MTASVSAEVRQDVADLLVRYATAIDRRDWTLFRSCFTEGCEADYGTIGAWNGVEELTSWMRDTHEPAGHTMHRITNQAVSPNAGGVAARSYVDAVVMLADNTSGTHAVGYYDDEVVLTDDGWKIARRRFTMVLLQLIPDGTIIDLEPPTLDRATHDR